jgi:hypothetical protein
MILKLHFQLKRSLSNRVMLKSKPIAYCNGHSREHEMQPQTQIQNPPLLC